MSNRIARTTLSLPTGKEKNRCRDRGFRTLKMDFLICGVFEKIKAAVFCPPKE